MSIFVFLYSICWAFLISLVNTSSPLDPSVQVRNAPGVSTAHTLREIRRALAEASVQKRDTDLKNTTSLDKSWNGVTLLKFGASETVSKDNKSSVVVNGGIDITCTECYVKGEATAELFIQGNFNATEVIDQTLDDVEGDIKNFTKEVDDYFVDYVEGVAKNLEDGIQLDDFALPTLDFDFNMSIPTIPECNLSFTFDGLELYMQVDTALNLGATYTLNLYSSNTPLGIHITKNLEVGIIFAVDLILSAQGEIDMSSGFHLQMEDGLALNIALFGEDVNHIIFNGGKFEFLPVTIQSAGIVLSAVLRVGVHSGFNLVTPSIPDITLFGHTLSIPTAGGGVDVSLFANVAEFTTNVTSTPQEDCKLAVVQSYQMALGGAAGATVAIDTYTWGPMYTKSVPIFYTEIASACAIQKTPAASSAIPTITPGPTANKRDDLSTTTIVTKITYTGVNCNSTGLINCPASLQQTSQTTETKTIITAVPSGADVTFPASIQSVVNTVVPFGKDAQSMPSSTGSPVSYVPPPPKNTGSDGNGTAHKILNGSTGGVSNKIIIGVSVGLGIPVLMAIIGTIVICCRRRQYHVVRQAPREAVPMMAQPYEGPAGEAYSDKPGKTGVSVREVEH